MAPKERCAICSQARLSLEHNYCPFCGRVYPHAQESLPQQTPCGACRHRLFVASNHISVDFAECTLHLRERFSFWEGKMVPTGFTLCREVNTDGHCPDFQRGTM